MTERSVAHADFTLERSFAATPAQVFHAFADREAKARWFEGPPGWERGRHEFDFRVGGREILSGGVKGGPVHTFECFYRDIVPNERIVYVYDMYTGDRRISVSLATLEFRPAGKTTNSGTRLIVTEQGVFLDGYDDAGSREGGTKDLIDKLEASLPQAAKA